MIYLMIYLVLGLCIIPFMVTKEISDLAPAWKRILFAYPLWPMVIAFAILVAVRKNYYSTYCAFCGDVYESTNKDDRDEAIKAHIRECEKHPMRIEIEEMRERLNEIEADNMDYMPLQNLYDPRD